MILLVGFYQDANAARTEEFLQCLRHNAANPHIEQIGVFLKERVGRTELAERYPELAHPKLQLVEHQRRVTFAELFEHANRRLSGQVVIVANADIFFDETLALLKDASLAGRMLCLTRWDEGADGVPRHLGRSDSQDASIFEPPLPAIACDFFLGKMGSDNRLAHEVEHARVQVSNPSLSVRARHLHLTAVRRYTHQERLSGPYRHLPATSLDGNPASIAAFPSHRHRRVEGAVGERCRELEAMLAPHLGGLVPRGLRRELRRALAALVDVPVEAAMAHVGFRERMGYTLAPLDLGVSSHNNDARPISFVPAPLSGKRFTQVVSDDAAPVEIEFQSGGRLYVLAARGWDGFTPAAAFLDAAGWREPMDPLRTHDGTTFEVWSLVAGAGERLVVPTQVMLVSDQLTKLG